MNTAGIVRAVRWLAWGLVALLLTLCVTLALGMGWLRSASGENWLRHEAVGQLNTLLVTEGMSVSVESLEGPLPEALRLRGLVVNDKRGPWLTVGQAEVRLDLAALLDPAVLLPLLAVNDVHLLRLPELAESAPSNAAFPQDLLSWYPSWLRFVRVDAVRLERLALPAELLGLPEGVAGENVVFSAQGALSVPHAEEIRTNLAVQVDMADSLALNAALHTTTGQLRLDVRFTEGENGLLARLAGDTLTKEGLPLPAGLELSLAGNAPLTNWDGDLSIIAAKLVQVQGRVGVSLKTDSDVKETLLRVNLEAQAEPEAPEAWQALGPVTVQTDARLAEGVLTVPEARLSLGAGEIVAENVRVSLPVSPVSSISPVQAFSQNDASKHGVFQKQNALAGTVRLRLTRPQDLSALFAEQALPFASAEATLSVTGTVAAPQVELLAEVRDLQSPDASAETLSAEASLTGTLTLPEARLRLRSPHMAVGGMEFQGFDVHLRLLGEAVDVANLAASTGKAELAVDVTTPHGPAQLRIEAALRDAKLVLSSLRLTGLGLGLDGNLTVPISGDVRASGTLTALVHDWAALSALLPVPVRAAKAEARLVLSPDSNQSATLDWNVQNLHVAEVLLSSLIGNVKGRDLLVGPKFALAVTAGEGQAGGGQVADDQAAKALWKGATLNFSGDASNHTASFSSELNSLTYGRVGEAYPIMAKLSGALQNGKTLACTLTVSGLGLEAVEGKVNLPVRFVDGLPDIPTDGPLAGEVRWHGALAQLWRLVPLANTRVRGDAEVDIKLGGTVANPRPTGGIRLKNVLFQDLAQAFEVSNIMAEISMQANGSGKARIEGTDGRKGTFEFSGTVGPAEAGFPLNIQGSIDRLMPLQRQDVRVSLSGTASVTGTATAPDVAADITVNGGQVLLDQLPSGGIDTIDVVEATTAESRAGTVESPAKTQHSADSLPQKGVEPPAQEGATSLPEVGRLKITVTVPNKFYVRGHGIESEWKGQLRINGPLTNPAISGELSSMRGTLSFLGKTFVLNRGSVAFDGGNPPRPMLDIQLGYTQQNFTALITLSGPAARPRLKLSSQPTLPTDEIVAQILFGRSTGGLARGEALQLAATVASLTVFGQGGGLQDFTRSALGLDVLRVGSSRPSSSSMGLTNSAFDAPGGQSISPSDASEDDLTLEVGKYVLDNVYVGLEQGMESRSTGVVVEIEVTPSLSIEARTNGRGSDVEATWSWDY